ncbi:dyslexia-associated protein KIAA0319-like protein isoform X3 [Rhipicephalus microplus]|uniref:dyslexia-associated protein KIAA0319-like protein isoform X3 n=1 Tax=Rhipicephalus microplus TaxID=6941 RepID=UPI003F6AD8C4
MRCRGRLLQIVWLSSLLVASIALDNDPDDEDVAAEEEDDEEDEFGGGDGGGFCPDSLFPKLTLLRHVTPRGNASAGRFTKVAHASSLMDCTKACCEQGPLCNLVFLHGSSCFLVRCRSAALCQPQRRPSTKFDSSFMVIVRPPQKGSSDSSHEWSSHSGPNSNEDTLPSLHGWKNTKGNGDSSEEALNSSSILAVPTAAPLSSSSTKAAAAASPTTTTPYPLIVSAGENKELHLPENEVVLSAYALKGGGDGNKFQYQWTLVSHPDGEETGVMQDQNTQALKLSHLREGLYTFRVAVTGNNSYGEATTNVTVLPPKRINKPPVAIIQPDNVTVKLPSKDTVLDGSFSTDDDKIVQYHWEPITIPIGYSPKLNDTPTVQLKDLIPGFYQFMLKVTDSDGVTNTTSANVTVLKEMDYPPTANAGPQSVVYMPNNEVTLNGNLSTDDKGIKSWEWTKSPDTDKHVDMEGTTSPYLHLSNMEVGVYKFLLKVTDTADQTATAEVHVFVKPASNQAPTANAGKDMRVSLPIDKPIMLDGSHSTDDVGITSWHWSQIQGPKPSRIEEPNSSTTRVSNLVPGEYVFKLDVVDANNLTSSDNVSIIITQNKNAPPKADAGGDRTVFLPVDVVSLNGSRSSDDVEIVSWHWTREPSSLAAGHILENSSFSPILRLSELIPGRYMFTLTVSDAQGATGQDTASLIVKPMPSLVQQVELLLDVDIETFTQEQLDTVLKQLELLLHDGESLRVHLVDLNYQQDSRRVRIIFVAEKEDAKGSWLPCRGPLMVARLKQRLRTHSALLDWDVISVDTVVCQNECSGHGTCDMYSKRCVCEAFWMEDFVRASLGDRESNCDWSVLYVIIIAFLLLSVLSTSLWGLACFCSRMHFRRPRIKRNYTLLKDSRDIEKDSLDLIPKGKTLTTSLMASDSDSDTLFETRPRPSVAVKPLTGNHRTGTSNGSLKNRVHT